jgi:hypothetical protein
MPFSSPPMPLADAAAIRRHAFFEADYFRFAIIFIAFAASHAIAPRFDVLRFLILRR